MKNTALKLLNWYNESNYLMPWRESPNPYNIWISEIMLQQTQVQTVKKYYNNWMKKYPSIYNLSHADIDDILKLWEGLGYYRRAHNILETSQIIVSEYNGNIPNSYKALIQLKGIGDYTASAILSIAFEKKYPAIDGNLKRVLSRLFIIKQNNRLQDNAKKYALQFMINNNPGDVNQAFMDLGREICLPKKPQCNICPLNLDCKAHTTDTIDKYPMKSLKKIKPSYDVRVGVIYKNNKFLISKRKKEGLLGGLWELPGGKKRKNETNYDCLHREIKEELNIDIKIQNKIGIIKHEYSHFKINLIGYNCNYKKGNIKPLTSDGLAWIINKNIKNFAFPKSTIKLFNIMD